MGKGANASAGLFVVVAQLLSLHTLGEEARIIAVLVHQVLREVHDIASLLGVAIG
jgi:hypothetical protein